jgi:hypothetical protein
MRFSENTGVTLLERKESPRSRVSSEKFKTRSKNSLIPAQGTFYLINCLSIWRPELSYQESKGEDCHLSIFLSPVTL